MALTDHTFETVFWFISSRLDGVPWSSLVYSNLSDSQGVFSLSTQVTRQIIPSRILYIIYRSRFDFTLGFLAYYRAAEVYWDQVSMDEKFFVYEWILGSWRTFVFSKMTENGGNSITVLLNLFWFRRWLSPIWSVRELVENLLCFSPGSIFPCPGVHGVTKVLTQTFIKTTMKVCMSQCGQMTNHGPKYFTGT